MLRFASTPYTFALLVAGLVAVGAAGACAETRRTNGQDCLKNDDCLSGVCSQLTCASAPPTTSVEATVDASPPEVSVSDAGSAAETAPPVEAGPAETGTPAEAGADGASDAAAEAGD
jgi:hypothetical protein